MLESYSLLFDGSWLLVPVSSHSFTKKLPENVFQININFQPSFIYIQIMVKYWVIQRVKIPN